MKRLAFLWIGFLAWGAAYGQELPVYTFLEAGNHIGEKAVVTGRVVGAYNSGKACFLNFHQDWRNHFSVVIFAKNYDRFASSPEVLYPGAEVRVTGEIKAFEGRSEIVVDDPSQIEIVGGKGAPVRISPQEAPSHLGKKVVVEGTIVGTENTGKLAFLRFDPNADSGLAVVLFERIFGQFPEPPEKYFLNRKVRVTGELKQHQGRPEIIVTARDQIVLPDAAGGIATESDEDAAAMLRALIDLLIEKGVFTREEFQQALVQP